MLHRIGTEKEITKEAIKGLPEKVVRELVRSTVILDYEYGAERDYLRSGGYSLIAENAEDVEAMGEVIDFMEHPCEWAFLICGYVTALYLLNDDFSVVVFIPKAFVPDSLIEDVEVQ